MKNKNIVGTLSLKFMKRLYKSLDKSASIERQFLGEFTGRYRNKTVPIYLKIPKIVSKKDYGEYGDFRGILTYVVWKETNIKIGTKVVKVPVYKKVKESKISFRRYNELSNSLGFQGLKYIKSNEQ